LTTGNKKSCLLDVGKCDSNPSKEAANSEDNSIKSVGLEPTALRLCGYWIEDRPCDEVQRLQDVRSCRSQFVFRRRRRSAAYEKDRRLVTSQRHAWNSSLITWHQRSSRNTARLFGWCAPGSPAGPAATSAIDVLERGREFAFSLEPDLG